MKLNTYIYVFIFVLLSWLRSSEAESGSFNVNRNLLPFNACTIVNCVQGTCRESDTSLLGFECDCYPGWTKYQLAPFIFTPCIIPNCTINSDCGDGTPSPPLPPPPFNLSDPCSFTWCGDGSCKTNENGYECDCNDGSDNLFDKPDLPCFKQCALGVDCHGVGLGNPPSTTSSSPPPQTPSSHVVGRDFGIQHQFKTVLLLFAVFHPWM